MYCSAWSRSLFLCIAHPYKVRGVRACRSCHLSVKYVWDVMRYLQEEDHNVTWIITWERASDVEGGAHVTWTIKLSYACWRSSSCGMNNQAELRMSKVELMWPERSRWARHIVGGAHVTWTIKLSYVCWMWSSYDLNDQVELYMLNSQYIVESTWYGLSYPSK